MFHSTKSKSIKIEIQEKDGKYYQPDFESKLLAFTDYIPLWSTTLCIVIMVQYELDRLKPNRKYIELILC